MLYLFSMSIKRNSLCVSQMDEHSKHVLLSICDTDIECKREYDFLHTLFKCEMCGICCISIFSDVLVSDKEKEYLTSKYHVFIGEDNQMNIKPCLFNKNNICEIYEHRPETCKCFPYFIEFQSDRMKNDSKGYMIVLNYNINCRAMIPLKQKLKHEFLKQ